MRQANVKTLSSAISKKDSVLLGTFENQEALLAGSSRPERVDDMRWLSERSTRHGVHPRSPFTYIALHVGIRQQLDGAAETQALSVAR